MKTLRIFITLILVSSSAYAGNFGSSQRGTVTAQFLTLGVGARAVAMGEAYSAAVDDASALYWNPAGLTRIEKRSIALMHAPTIDSSYVDYGAYGQKLGERGAWGVAAQYFNAGSVDQTDTTGTNVGELTPSDLAVSVGYAYRLSGRFFDGTSLGFAGKYIRSKLEQAAETAAVDVGLMSPAFCGDRLRFALVAQNMGGKLKFERESEALPFAVRLGSAYRISDRWLSSLDAVFPRDDNPYGALGTEYMFAQRETWTMAGRLGYNARTTGSVDGVTGVSFGFGFSLNRIAVDYGFLPFGSVGEAHRVSLSYPF